MRLQSSLNKEETLIPHGKGTITAEDGSVSEGLFRDGLIVEGLRIFTNGERYEGQFKNN